MFGSNLTTYGQCNTLRQQFNLTFNTDGDCAPVDVTDYTITYFFNTVQDPNDIVIHYEWNDPAASFNKFKVGDPGFVIGGGNTEFTATGTFSYPENNSCLFEPLVYVIVAGVNCETSEQTQPVSSWSADNDFGGVLEIAPNNFNVCFGTSITGAIFTDNSTFNCVNDPDNPNEQERHTQFVYGTNHNPANSIRNLSLVDNLAATQNLTDNTGALAMTSTVNGVTGAYFGEIVRLSFPAVVPNMTSFAISAPADAANVIGSQFQITLYNWNTCNPYNGNAASPNYADAVEIQASVVIVQEPMPDFQTRLNNATGSLQSVFCLGDDIYFENLTPGGFDYLWEFFDDNTGTSLLNSNTNANPTFSYSTAGDKLIRLTAIDPDAGSICEVIHEEIVNLSPAAIAGIGVFESTFTSNMSTDFCQDSGNTLSFDIGFRDETTNTEPDTQWRWEFYDENDVLSESLPVAAATYSPTPITDFIRTYSTPGQYQVRLIARNVVTMCETIDNVDIFIYPVPVTSFAANEVCAGERTTFSAISDSITSLVPRVNDDRILNYDWDFSYNGAFFTQELRRNNDDDFDWFLDGNTVLGEVEPMTSLSGTYTIALQVTTEQRMCVGFFTQEVTVNVLPDAILTSDYTSPVCPGDEVMFTNNSVNTGIINYELIVHRLSDGDMDTVAFVDTDLPYAFQNSTVTSLDFEVFIRSINEFDCENSDGPINVNVLPSSVSGFTDPTYNPLTNNCSPWNSAFVIDAATQVLDADSYTWNVVDLNGAVAGFPMTKNKGDTDFNQLDYQVINTELTNQTYMATLEVTKSGVCVDDSFFTFQISPQPEAQFTFEQFDSCTFKIFRIEATQKGLVNYDWSFSPMPDQIVNQTDVQTIRYERPIVGGSDISINAELQTTNLANCDSEIESTGLNVDAAFADIVIDFSLSDDMIQLPDNTITIQNNSTNDPTWNYEWNFGDGSSFNGFDPGSHEYDTFGNYVITLTISNPFCESTLLRSLVILPTVPIIEFQADVLQGCQPLTVNFSNLSEFAVPGTYTWDFGDGTVSNQDQPSYTYFNAGKYTVSLKGENELGTEGQTVKAFYIDVLEVPIANYALNPEVVFIPDQKVFFSNLSSNATTYEWQFGDGETSTETNTSHPYTEEGFYDVTLIAKNDLGCADTLSRQAAIEAKKGGTVRTPNAFTPNISGPSGGIGGGNGGSGSFNDIFSPRVEGVTSFKMLIYNKWGQVLFESDDQEIGWDGYFEGKIMPMDVYVYKLVLDFSDGRKEVRLGDVTLVR